MAKQGSYSVNPGPPPKDTSFRSFICALLVFLALCIVIFLVLMFVGGRGKKEETKEQQKEVDVFEDNHKKSDKLIVVKVPDEKKEYGSTTTEYKLRTDGTDKQEKLKNTERTPDVTTTNTSKPGKNIDETTLGNDIYDITEKEKLLSYTDRNFKTETTTSRRETDIYDIYDTTEKNFKTATTSSRGDIEIYDTTEREKLPLYTDRNFKTETAFSRGDTDGIFSTSFSTTEENSELQFETTTETGTDYGIDHNLFHKDYLTSEVTGSTEGITETTDVSTSRMGQNPALFPSQKGSTTDDILKSSISYDSTESTSESETFSSLPSSRDKTWSTENQTWQGTTESQEAETADLMGAFGLTTTEIADVTTEAEGVEGSSDTSTSWETTEYSETPKNQFSSSYSDQPETSSESIVPSSTRKYANIINSVITTTEKLQTDREMESSLPTEFTSTDLNADSTTESTSMWPWLNPRTKNYVEDVTSSTYSSDLSSWETTESQEDSSDRTGSTSESIVLNTTRRKISRILKYLPTSPTTTENATQESTTISQYQKTGVASTELVTNVPLKPTTTTASHNVYVTDKSIPGTLIPYPPTCTVSACKKTASKLLYLINHDGDACQSFYEFACGGQPADEDSTRRKNLNFLIGSLAEVNKSSEMYRQQYKLFYESCISHELDFKYFPRLQFLYDFPTMNLTDLFAELILTQSMPLFDIGLDIEKNTEKYIFELTLPGQSSLKTSIPGWSLLENIRQDCLKKVKQSIPKNNINFEKLRLSLEACQKQTFRRTAESFVQEMSREFPRDYNSVYNETTLEKLLFLIDEMQLFLPSQYKIRRSKMYKDHGYTHIENLNSTTGYNLVDWVAILTKLTFNSVLDETHEVNVYFDEYFTNMFQLLLNYTESELTDMLWLYSRLQLYVNTVVPREKETRELYCMDLTKQLLPDTTSVITYSTVKNQAQTDAIPNVKDLFQRLKDDLGGSLMDSKMDAFSRDILREKLKRLQLGVISRGDNNIAMANSRYVSISPEDYQQNVVDLLRNYKKIVYSLEGMNATAATLLRYFVDPFYNRPKAFYPSRFIVAHSAFYENQPTELPSYIHLATMGMHLGQELSKHFDPIGRKFLVRGNTDSSKDFYDDVTRRTEDLLFHYANYTYTIWDESLYFDIDEDKKNVWINQMIVDNAAFRLIDDAYNNNEVMNLPWVFRDFSLKQVFYLAAAQEYCKPYDVPDFVEDYFTGDLPPPLKVQNFLSNSKEFAKTFDCPEGTAMVIYEDQMAQFPHIDNFADYEDQFPSD